MRKTTVICDLCLQERDCQTLMLPRRVVTTFWGGVANKVVAKQWLGNIEVMPTDVCEGCMRLLAESLPFSDGTNNDEKDNA